jgi:hypothetical protein
LDLLFVRDLVAPLYEGGGRPCVDPVVSFRLQSSSCSSSSAQGAKRPSVGFKIFVADNGTRRVELART